MNGSFLLSDLEEDGRVDAGSRFTGARAGDFEERMELAELCLQDASLCVSVAEATPHAPCIAPLNHAIPPTRPSPSRCGPLDLYFVPTCGVA